MLKQLYYDLFAMSLAAATFSTLPARAQNKDIIGTRLDKEIRFEVVSLRPVNVGPNSTGFGNTFGPSPNGFRSTMSIWQLIQMGYAPEYNMSSGIRQTVNQPAWCGDPYNIDARVSNSDLKAWQAQSYQIGRHELLRAALRAMLKERCKLTLHEQPSVEPTLELVVGSRGSRLKAAAPVAADLDGLKLPGGGVCVSERLGGYRRERLHFHGATIGDLVWFLSRLSPTVPIRDKTGLTGRYDFTLQELDEHPDGDRVYSYPIAGLGLKLKAGKENRPKLVIDHIEKPTPN